MNVWDPGFSPALLTPIIIWIAELNNGIQKGDWGIGLPLGGGNGGERSIVDEDQGGFYVEGSCLYCLEK